MTHLASLHPRDVARNDAPARVAYPVGRGWYGIVWHRDGVRVRPLYPSRALLRRAGRITRSDVVADRSHCTPQTDALRRPRASVDVDSFDDALTGVDPAYLTAIGA